MSLRLVVGLGNPGRRYALTRHNVGFEIVERLAEEEGIKVLKKGFASLWGKGVMAGEEVLFLLPQTFMNRSGTAVREAKESFRIDDQDILIVHDDLDLPLGRIKLDFGAGPAGHRGVTSVVESLATKKFYRIRVGIGRPAAQEEVEAFVLSPFTQGEEAEVKKIMTEAMERLRRWIVRLEVL